MHFRKPELIPLLFIIGATALLVTLGTWQVERLQWKNAQVAEIEKAQALAPLTSLPKSLDKLEALNYRNVQLRGVFLYNKALHLVGHPQGATEQGFYILTPMRLEKDGRVILVNRGFSPKDKESTPEGVQTVKGVIRPQRLKRYFSPENAPEKNVWFFEDFTTIAKSTGTELTPVIVEAVGPQERDVWPQPSDGTIVLRNDHLQYAITWFSIALIGLVMFVIYHRVPEKE